MLRQCLQDEECKNESEEARLRIVSRMSSTNRAFESIQEAYEDERRVKRLPETFDDVIVIDVRCLA